jgi:hypothetical protein
LILISRLGQVARVAARLPPQKQSSRGAGGQDDQKAKV